MRTLKLCKQISIVGKDSDVEPVSMRISYKNVTSICRKTEGFNFSSSFERFLQLTRYVYSIGKVCDILATDPSYKYPVLSEDNNIVTL